MNEAEDIIYKQKLFLTRDYVYNPEHKSFQKIKLSTEKFRSFYNIVFSDVNNLCVASQEYRFDSNSSDKKLNYLMNILYYGTYSRTLDSFKLLINTITNINTLINSDMVKYVDNMLARLDFVLINTQKINYRSLLQGGQFDFVYQKAVDNHVLFVHLKFPINKIYVYLNGTKKICILDIYIPRNIIELNNVTNNISFLKT